MKKILSLVFIPILACSLFISSGCVKDAASTPVTTTPISSSTPQPEDKHLDWLLYATKYSADGQVLEEFQFTVTGTVPGKQDLSVFLQPVTLDIVWPDSFRFSGNGEETYSGLASSDHETDYF